MGAASSLIRAVLLAPARSATVVHVVPAAAYLTLPADGPAVPAPGTPRVIALLARDAVRLPLGMAVDTDTAGTPFAGLEPGHTVQVGDGWIRTRQRDWPVLRWWDPAVPVLPRPTRGLRTPEFPLVPASLLDPVLPARPLPPPDPVLVTPLRRLAEVLTGRAGPARGTGLGTAAGTGSDTTVAPDLGTDPGDTGDTGDTGSIDSDAAGGSDLDADLDDAVSGLIGLGPGLTPAGDDVLAGALAGLASAGEHARPLFARLAASVIARVPATTLISGALLDCAAAGTVIPELGAFLLAVSGDVRPEPGGTSPMSGGVRPRPGGYPAPSGGDGVRAPLMDRDEADPLGEARVAEAARALVRVGHTSGTALGHGALLGLRAASAYPGERPAEQEAA
jgi:hypothetical protein